MTIYSKQVLGTIVGVTMSQCALQQPLIDYAHDQRRDDIWHLQALPMLTMGTLISYRCVSLWHYRLSQFLCHYWIVSAGCAIRNTCHWRVNVERYTVYSYIIDPLLQCNFPPRLFFLQMLLVAEVHLIVEQEPASYPGTLRPAYDHDAMWERFFFTMYMISYDSGHDRHPVIEPMIIVIISVDKCIQTRYTVRTLWCSQWERHSSLLPQILAVQVTKGPQLIYHIYIYTHIPYVFCRHYGCVSYSHRTHPLLNRYVCKQKRLVKRVYKREVIYLYLFNMIYS